MLITAILGAVAQAAAPLAPAADSLAWGASPEAVRSAVAGRPSPGTGHDFKNLRVLWRGHDRIDDVEVESLFYFNDAQSLEIVGFEAPPARCREVAASIAQRFGPPVTTSDQTILRLIIWHDEPHQRRLRLLVSSAGICTLYYERLSEYREHDLARQAQP